MTIDQVMASAPVPAYCDMPAQTLTGGKTDASLKPKLGELITDDPAPVQADIDGDGAQELVVRYLCSAGGVTWPEIILVYGPGPTLRGHVKLGDIAQTEHATVTKWSNGTSGFGVWWTSYEGAGSDMVFRHSSLSLSSMKTGAALSDVEEKKTDRQLAAKLVNDFLAAAVKGDTKTMSSLAKPAALKEFTNYGDDWRTPSTCKMPADGPLACEISIGSGPPASDNYGLIFTFEVEAHADGTATISAITFGGDAG